MSGTKNEQTASDQRNALVWNIRNCTYQAPPATSAAKRILPKREFGVVFGSEIMKNEKISRAPFSRRCSGIVSGSPRPIARAKRIADQKKRNASVTSLPML